MSVTVVLNHIFKELLLERWDGRSPILKIQKNRKQNKKRA